MSERTFFLIMAAVTIFAMVRLSGISGPEVPLAHALVATGDDDDDDDAGPRLYRMRCDYILEVFTGIKEGGDPGGHKDFIDLEEVREILIECGYDPDTLPRSVSLRVPAGIPGEMTFGKVDPGNWVDVTGTYDPQTGRYLGEGTGTVAGFPNVSVLLDIIVGLDGQITGTYTMGAHGELPGGSAAVYDVSGLIELLPEVTPTATPVPSATEPSITSTPVPTGGLHTRQLAFGNLDCDPNGISSRDNQSLLRKVLDQAPLSQTEPCPDTGVSTSVFPAGGQPLAWGDLDCNGQISSRDNQALLRKVLEQAALSQTEPCPDLGSDIAVEFQE